MNACPPCSHRRVIGAGMLGVLLLMPGARAQEPTVDQVLQRTAVWVARFVADFANVVAQEDYWQEYRFGASRRRLTSDFLLVRYPGDDGSYLAFRDVVAVDGRPVHDQQDRLATLFLEPFDDARRRAEEIMRDGSRHSLVALGQESSPFAVITLLQSKYQPEHLYRLGRVATKRGLVVRALEFERRTIPTPGGDATGAPMHATAWVDERTGRVVETELRVGAAPGAQTTVTTFRIDDTLGITVPDEMRETRPAGSASRRGFVAADAFIGTARYSRFRRFQVRTTESVEAPAALK